MMVYLTLVNCTSVSSILSINLFSLNFLSSSKEIIKNLSPKFLQELEGLAEGLNMELDRTIKLFSGYDVVFPEMGCTTLADLAMKYDLAGVASWSRCGNACLVI